MEKRALLALVLSLVVFIVFGYLSDQFQPPPSQETAPSTDKTAVSPPTPVEAPKPVVASAPTLPKTVTPSRPAQDVVIETPLYKAVLTEEGARLKSFQLKKYWEQLPFTAIADFGIGPFSIDLKRYQDFSHTPPIPKELNQGLPSPDLPLAVSYDKDAATVVEPVFYSASQKGQTLKSQDEGKVTFTHVRPDGIVLMKTLTFHGDSYRIDLQVTVKNQGTEPSQGNLGLALTNSFTTHTGNEYGFFGFVGSINKKREEIKSTDLKELKTLTGQVNWASLEDGYFMKAVVPQSELKSILTLQEPPSKLMTLTLKTALEAIAPGQAVTVPYALYIGPKDLEDLKQLHLGLEGAVDFGWFNFLALPLLYVLKFLNGYLHNYGLAIIIITILIRIIFIYPNHKSNKSMKDMQKLQPKIAKLREKYKDNREEMNKELMALYRTYKVNPVGGCLPMLLQLPVFIALYNLLGYAIELRHASFISTIPFTNIVWLADLSAKDPLLITPIIMGATMFIQQKMTPSPGDPTQAKLMLLMPIIFTFMFLNFASGLVLYWLVNNVLAIAQQHITNKYLA